MPFVIVLAFLGAWYLVNEISLHDTISILIFLFFQTIVGVRIVRLLLKSALGRSGELAIAFAIGGIVFTSIDQIIVNLHLDDKYSIASIIGLGLLATFTGFRQKYKVPHPDDWRLALLTPFIIAFGYFRNSPGIFFGVVVTILLFTFSFYPKLKNSIVFLSSLTFLSLCTFLLVISIARLQTESYGGWMLRPLYSGTDDQIFSESLSWALAKFGLSDYPAAVGLSIRYHWFSLAWSGIVTKVTGAEPFVVTLHVVPTTLFVIISWGTYQLSQLLSNSRHNGFLAVFVLFGSASAIEPFRFAHVINTSNIVPLMWVVLLIVCLHFNYLEVLRYPTLVIPLIIGVLLISKVPFGVSSLIGTSACAILMCTQGIWKRGLVMLLNCWVVAIASYLLFLSPHQWERRQFSFDTSVGGFAPLSSFSTLLGFGAIVAWFSPLILALPTIFKGSRLSSESIIVTFLITGSIMAIFRFVLDGNSAELYFANFGLFCTAPLVALGLRKILPRTKISVRLSISSVVAIPTLLMYLELTMKPLSRYAGTDLVLIYLPPVFAVCMIALGMVRKSLWPILSPMSLGFLVIVALSFTVSLHQFYPKEYLVSPERVASTDEIEALQWLRQNSTADSILATNVTLCRDSPTCTTDQSRFVMSAFSRRRAFIEGPRFVIGGLPYPDWATERINVSLDFAATPNQRDFEVLRQHNVDWFVLGVESGSDFAKNEWSNFGKVRFETPSIKVIELNH